jgi:hypothetical protein
MNHYYTLYIVCKCLSNIIYYDLYMHKDFKVNCQSIKIDVSRSSVIMFISQNLVFNVGNIILKLEIII